MLWGNPPYDRNPCGGFSALIIPPSRLQTFRAVLDEAASSTAATLGRSGSFPWDLSVSRVALCCLSDFPERAVFCGGEMMASVLVRLRGPIVGTSVISLEPPHALTLIRSLGVEGDPLETFRTAAAGVLRGMLGWIGAAGGAPAEWGDPILEERPLVATVLGTHAPPNTMVVSLGLGFASSGQAFPAHLYLLLDAKILQTVLERLERVAGRSSGSAR
jgi:hypothetical protein